MIPVVIIKLLFHSSSFVASVTYLLIFTRILAGLWMSKTSPTADQGNFTAGSGAFMGIDFGTFGHSQQKLEDRV